MKEELVKLVEYLKKIKCKNISTFDLSENGEEKYFVIVSATSCDETKKIDFINDLKLVLKEIN